MDIAAETLAGCHVFEPHGRALRIMDHPLVLAAARAFSDGSEEGTLQFFDATLPDCMRMIDFGAHFGFTTLYAAASVPEVFAFEPSPTNFALLAENVARNTGFGARIRLFRHGVADRDDEVMLYAKAAGDSGSSIFRTIERDTLISGAPDATVAMRNADAVLREIGLDRHTLLKIDIGGAEYLVVPAIAALLAERRPYLHISFHPFNIVATTDEYANTVERVRRAMQVAEALACYRFMHLFSHDTWFCIGAADRADFLRQYLLRPKPVPRVATPQYGFIDAVGFSDDPLPVLHGR